MGGAEIAISAPPMQPQPFPGRKDSGVPGLGAPRTLDPGTPCAATVPSFEDATGAEW